MITPEQLSKLPQYAQRYIDVLERNLASAKAKLSAGPEDSTVIADPYGDTPRPLGTHTTVRFGEGRTGFDVRLRDGRLHVLASDAVAVHPAGGVNVVDISVEDR